MLIVCSWIVVFTTSSEEGRIGKLLRAALLTQLVPSSLESDVLSTAKFAVSQNSKIGVS
ncbi:hypothetical protein DPMN_165797 [Dreissena polymorpha]|uniref:Uncharacterized protein n=1 Tax=Dreissena polymorpha TaxID=45954 RepID=A0A9D4IUY0_DREPO|nr:hypothetical protein DPMN_165797 [Dreissena polymorpha]